MSGSVEGVDKNDSIPTFSVLHIAVAGNNSGVVSRIGKSEQRAQDIAVVLCVADENRRAN